MTEMNPDLKVVFLSVIFLLMLQLKWFVLLSEERETEDGDIATTQLPGGSVWAKC